MAKCGPIAWLTCPTNLRNTSGRNSCDPGDLLHSSSVSPKIFNTLKVSDEDLAGHPSRTPALLRGSRAVFVRSEIRRLSICKSSRKYLSLADSH
jgi:hypothetical protein